MLFMKVSQSLREVESEYKLHQDSVEVIKAHMGGSQNSGPFLGPCNNAAPNIQGTQEGTLILTTTHMVGLFEGCNQLGFTGLEARR